MARRSRDGLSQHPPIHVEHTGGEIAAFAHHGAERCAQQRLRLFLDHRNQTVPHDLQINLAETGEHGGSKVESNAVLMS